MPSKKNFWRKFIQPIGNYDDMCYNAYILTQSFSKLKVAESWMQASYTVQEDLKFTEFACHASLETHLLT